MPRLKFNALLAAQLILLFGGTGLAKEWRGITPLRSTRGDVVRLFNQCSGPNPGCEFTFGDEEVRIEFSGDSTSNLHGCVSTLPSDTVLLIEISPKKALRLNDFIRKNNLRAFTPTPPSSGYKGYIDNQQGLVLKAYGMDVVQADYIAASEDRGLCQNYYDGPEAFIQDMLFPHGPTLLIACPTNTLDVGKEIRFSTNFPVVPKITFDWTTSSGRIVKGLGTSAISVDTTGLEGQVIKASVRLGHAKASCEVQLPRQRGG